MFDRVVLCTEGKTLHDALRAKNLTLDNDALVQVYLKNESGLDSSFDMAGVTASTIGDAQKLTTVFSNQTELHVAAYGSSDTASVGGYYAVVVVSGKALICARSDERLIANEKLAMTFDVEETNGVLKATADFDGNITQGILKKLVGSGKVSVTKYAEGDEFASFTVNDSSDTEINLGLGTAADANALEGGALEWIQEGEVSGNHDYLVNLYQAHELAQAAAGDVVDSIGEGTLTISAGNNSVTFSANAFESTSLTLGEAANKGVDTEIVSGSDVDLLNLPTSSAVDAFVGKGTLTILKRSSEDSFTFSANAHEDATVDLALGTAADKDALLENDMWNVAEHGDKLTSLSQVMMLIDDATALSALAPEAAFVPTVRPQVGQMMWLAINFSGQVGIVDFTTSTTPTATPSWNGTSTSETDAYLAEIVDNAGDFRVTQHRVVEGCTFRTLNAMDSTGMTSPAYGFALCVCTAVPASEQ